MNIIYEFNYTQFDFYRVNEEKRCALSYDEFKHFKEN